MRKIVIISLCFTVLAGCQEQEPQSQYPVPQSQLPGPSGPIQAQGEVQMLRDVVPKAPENGHEYVTVSDNRSRPGWLLDNVGVLSR